MVKMYVTSKCLIKGIEHVEGRLSLSGTYFICKYGWLKIGLDAFRLKAEAITRANLLKQRMLINLQKKTKKVEMLEFK